MKKAQILSMDLLIAVLIVLIIMGTLAVFLYQYQIYDEQQKQLRDLELRSEPALNVIMLTKGNPEDWESSASSCSDIKTLGIMHAPSIISEQKLKNLTLLDYDCVRNTLGIPGYDFYFEARNSTGQLFSVGGTTIQSGILPPAGSEAIFSTRKAITDGSNLIDISLGVWYE